MLCARAPGHSRGAGALLAAGGVVARPMCRCAPPPEGGGGYGPCRVKPRQGQQRARLGSPRRAGGWGLSPLCGGVLRSPLARPV